jgi:murein DD-endopeptidase MepM/ murein hydrolase activator NlpD
VLLIAMLLVGTTAISGLAQTSVPVSTVHVVQRGETLFSIAQVYGTTADAIAHANGITDPRQIYVGQELVIPDGGESVGMQELVPYVVQAGDTVASIAKRYGTTWTALVHVNRMLSPNTLYAGQVIQVPRVSSPDDDRVSLSRSGLGAIYVVRSGDTLPRIGLRQNISPWALAEVNQLTSPAMVYSGQALVIPGEGPGPLPAPFLSVEVQPLPITQGSTAVIAVHTTEPVTLEGRLFEQDVHFAEENGTYYGMAGVHVFTEPGLYKLTLVATGGGGESTTLATEVVVTEGAFGYERIDLPADRAALLAPDVIAKERERLDSVRFIFSPQRHWVAPLQRPSVGTISAYFGTHRAYNDGPYTSYHTGVDFKAPSGTPVYAPSAGIIVLAEPLTVRGNTILIDHGWGMLTGYWHLSSIDVQVGQFVEQGDMIGRVGNTGLSTGAHLHWEVWIGGTSVNGMQWLEETFPWPRSEGLATGG